MDSNSDCKSYEALFSRDLNKKRKTWSDAIAVVDSRKRTITIESLDTERIGCSKLFGRLDSFSWNALSNFEETRVENFLVHLQSLAPTETHQSSVTAGRVLEKPCSSTSSNQQVRPNLLTANLSKPFRCPVKINAKLACAKEDSTQSIPIVDSYSRERDENTISAYQPSKNHATADDSVLASVKTDVITSKVSLPRPKDLKTDTHSR